ncbi:MAG TPA: hypothetical protein VLA89_12140 [Gemmatimonadales bacterium]|nr:hypothetical protein [Gemmatimonadales bacterium]
MPAKVISERLGHATAAFTVQTYTHVITGMDEKAAATVASLILANRHRENADGSILGSIEGREEPQKEAGLGHMPGPDWWPAPRGPANMPR